MYRILIEFPDKATADRFIGWLMDGFGENELDFTEWLQLPGTDGTEPEHWERATSGGMPLCFCKSVGPDDDEDAQPPARPAQARSEG